MNYGILSLLPPIIAVILAIKSKNVILSLFCGGFAGVMIFSHGNPFLAVKSMIGDYLFVQLTDSYNAGVIVLIIFIGGFIKLMEKSGGAQAFSQSVYRYVNTKLKAQLCAWAGGIVFTIRGRFENGEVWIPEVKKHASGILSSMAGCNCLVDISAGTERIEAGESVTICDLSLDR